MPGCELWERLKHFDPEVWSLHLFSSVSSSPSRPSPCGNILKNFTQIHSLCAQMVPALSLALVAEEKSSTNTVLQEKQASAACQCFVYTVCPPNPWFSKHHASFHSPLKDGISQKFKCTQCYASWAINSHYLLHWAGNKPLWVVLS